MLIASDDLIAGILHRNGLATGNGNRWTRERVTSLRSNYKIPLYRPAPDGVEPYLNLSKATTLPGIAAKNRGHEDSHIGITCRVWPNRGREIVLT